MTTGPHSAGGFVFSVKWLAALFALAWVSGAAGQSWLIQYRGPADSGFLDDYKSLRPDDARPGVFVFRAPDVDVTEYDRVVVSPVEIWYDPNSAYQGIRPEELQEITVAARELMIRRLAEKLAVVDRAESGSLMLQLALTNVYAKRPKRGVLASAPVGLAKIGVKKARGKDYVVTGAQLEAELRDATTGERVGAILVTELATPGADDMTWEQILEVLDRYAKRLASNF
jgi:hypothetical protein